MQPQVDYDVVIIGAGPAGSAAAIAYKRAAADLRIALVDKSTFPRDKACGDGLGPGVLAVLAELGLSGIVAGERRLTGVEVRGPRGTVVEGTFPVLDEKATFGAVVERRRFDARLQQTAIDLGVTDLSGWRFVASEVRGGARFVDLTRADESSTISTSLVVGADGASSRVRKSLGAPRNKGRHTGVGIRAYATISTPSGRPPDGLLLDYEEQLSPGYGWVFPMHDGRSNIGVFMVATDRKKLEVTTADLLDSYIRHLETSGFTVSDVTSERSYILPYAAGMPTLAHRRAALIGDAASMINPWSGEGIFYGMEAGRILAQETHGHLEASEDTLDGALQRFERRFRKRFSWHLKSCHIAQRVTRSRRVSAGILRIAEQDETVFDYLVSLMFGEAGVEPRMVVRMVRRGLWAALCSR
jgi:geranylgeranyl reductase family protein